jgi:hypothetical protein
MAEYELAANEYHETTSKPGDPFTYKTYTKGDKVTVEDDERAQELIAAGALVDPKAAKARKAAKDDEGPAQSEPPEGELDEDEQVPQGSLASPQNPDKEGAGVVLNTDTDAPTTQRNSGTRRRSS